MEFATKDKPDLCILNVTLSDMSGLDIYNRLKENPDLEKTEVLFITDRKELGEELKSKHQDFISKPYDPKSLLARVDQALQRKASAEPQKRIKRVSTPEAPKVKLKGMAIASETIEKISPKFVRYYKFMPIKLEENVLTVAVTNPDDLRLQDDLRQYLGYDLRTVLADENDIEESIKQYYGVGAETVDEILAGKRPEDQEATIGVGGEKEEDIAKLAQDASVIKLVNQILMEAQHKNATDIHIEPYQDKLKLRYRIDGILHDAKVPSNIVYLFPAIISRMKIMSGLNIVERRLPQDGQAKVKVKNETVDLRVSTLPTPYGESMMIRVLPTRRLVSLEELGLLGKELAIFEDLIKKPHGIIFLTGPTGSGKTTTLYTCLTKIKTENTGAKIISIEDPIEYELERITQIQVKPEIDLTFARGLRSMLRHDPDIMMVGEVRDFETAEISIRMALTGHLLFSTLHTNDAASGVARLMDMGVEPYLITSSVSAFIAQRLVRVICPDCKEKSGTDESCRGKGCENCNFTGYKGRTALFEILPVDEEIRKLILQKAPAGEIKKKAVLQGMKTLAENGQEKVRQGITTPEEVLRVTEAKPAAPGKRKG